jgi:hypothetical protein
MERSSRLAIPACPTLFTPLQMHSRELLRLGTVSWVGWMRDHTISLQQMIERHRFAVVVAGASLSYTGKHVFPDSDSIVIDTTSSVHRRGVLIEGVSRFMGNGKEFARMNLHLRPVAIGDENSAAARSADLHPDVHALFHEDEVRTAPYLRNVKRLLPGIELEGQALALGRHDFKLHRYAMDFADQWAFMETYAFASAGREELALRHGGEHDVLLQALAEPVREFHVELSKPYFVLDRGVVETHAYLWTGQLTFVHRLLNPDAPESQVHATVIEVMATPLH